MNGIHNKKLYKIQNQFNFMLNDPTRQVDITEIEFRSLTEWNTNKAIYFRHTASLGNCGLKYNQNNRNIRRFPPLTFQLKYYQIVEERKSLATCIPFVGMELYFNQFHRV